MDKPRVRTDRFLEWYFSDKEDYIKVGKMVEISLKIGNEFHLMTSTLFLGCETIPSFITENYTSEDTDFSPYECELVE